MGWVRPVWNDRQERRTYQPIRHTSHSQHQITISAYYLISNVILVVLIVRICLLVLHSITLIFPRACSGRLSNIHFKHRKGLYKASLGRLALTHSKTFSEPSTTSHCFQQRNFSVDTDKPLGLTHVSLTSEQTPCGEKTSLCAAVQSSFLQ